MSQHEREKQLTLITAAEANPDRLALGRLHTLLCAAQTLQVILVDAENVFYLVGL